MKIIVADDSSFVRNIIVKSIKTNIENIEIISCVNGKEVWDCWDEHNPKWLVTDLLMPEMTGQELIKKLNDAGKNPNVIVISADIQKGTKDELESLNIKHQINKPLNPEKLQTLIDILRGA